MSNQQLETRLSALTDERNTRIKDLATWQGSIREATFLCDQIKPGLDHEQMQQRMKKLQQAEQQASFELNRVEGALKETLYWIHQTPDGDPPSALAGEMDIELNGHRVDQQLSEGDLDAHALLDEPEPVLVN